MTADRIPALLEPIQNRLNAALPGPWEPMRAGLLGTRVVSVDGEWEGIIPPEFIKMVTPAMRNYDTAVFIAAAPTDQARLLAALEAVEDWCKNLDAMEEVDPSSPGHRNVSAKGVAGCIRAAVVAALGGEA